MNAPDPTDEDPTTPASGAVRLDTREIYNAVKPFVRDFVNFQDVWDAIEKVPSSAFRKLSISYIADNNAIAEKNRLIAKLFAALKAAKALTDNMNEFGKCTDAEIYDAAWQAIEAALIDTIPQGTPGALVVTDQHAEANEAPGTDPTTPEMVPPAGERIRSTQDGSMEAEPVTGQSPVGSASHHTTPEAQAGSEAVAWTTPREIERVANNVSSGAFWLIPNDVWKRVNQHHPTFTVPLYTSPPDATYWKGAYERMAARNVELAAALEPFAAVAERDIGESETDADWFSPMQEYNRAPRLTVGHFRAALSTHNEAQSAGKE